jgi:hypothetical protein
MVGKRTWTSGLNGDGKKKSHPKPAVARFQDALHKAVEDDQREQIKNRLIDGVEREALEEYRKSKDEVGCSCALSQSRMFSDSIMYRSRPSRTKRSATFTSTRMNP